jgi:hypothetical protein
MKVHYGGSGHLHASGILSLNKESLVSIAMRLHGINLDTMAKTQFLLLPRIELPLPS